MTEYTLQVTLQSPLTSAAGEGRVGVVDRDVAFDDLGLPILPGRRLKGLWREAYRDVADAWELCGESPISVERIFGESGQKPGDGDACLYVANAELQEASSLRKWLNYLQHPKIQKLHPDDVVQHFATVRAQTAIDRHTGVAKKDTLRLTRTLKTGLVFQARVRFFEPPGNALLNALSLGAAALQHMGTARTRGLGKVCCRLLVRDENGQCRDLTEQAPERRYSSFNNREQPHPTIPNVKRAGYWLTPLESRNAHPCVALSAQVDSASGYPGGRWRPEYRYDSAGGAWEQCMGGCRLALPRPTGSHPGRRGVSSRLSRWRLAISDGLPGGGRSRGVR